MKGARRRESDSVQTELLLIDAGRSEAQPSRLARLLLVLLVTAWHPSVALGFGRGDKGTSAAAFLKLSAGARPAAMGDAFGGLADDLHAAQYNPAGLGFLTGVEAAATHDVLFQDLRHDVGVFAAPLLSLVDTRRQRNALGVAAFSVISFGAAGIPRRGVIETDDPTGTFAANDYAYALSYGRALDARLALGGTLKLVEQSLDSAHARSAAVDAGVLWRAKPFSLGAGWRHFGGPLRLGSSPDPLPFTAYAGAALRPLPGTLFAVEVRVPRDDAPRLSLGAELTRGFGALSAALRGGYNSSNADAEGLGGVSFGGGACYGRAGVDFAWVPFGDLGATYRTTVRLKF